MEKKNQPIDDIASLNQNILSIDLGDLEVEPMEQRLEMTLATLFGADFWEGPDDDPANNCNQFSCTMYQPAL
ncbi:MAG: hypothetical protein AAF657_26680 [Acidobacteriota bacterium]